MESPEETVQYIATQIGYVYYRPPLMYGGTGAGVETYLLDHHQIWAFIVDRQSDLRDAFLAGLATEDCGSADFSTRYAMNHPNATQADIADYVVAQWRKISDRLNVPIPHSEIRQELTKFSEG